MEINKNIVSNKAITLIALIITIIIMLILLGVGTNIVINGDLIGTTENTVDKWSNKVTDDQNKIDDILGNLDDKTKEKCKHSYEDGKCTNCGSELIIGATINYKEYIDPNTDTAFTAMPYYESTEEKNGYTSTTYSVVNNSGIEWIVLGEENGQIKITTKDVVEPSSGGYVIGNFTYLRLYGYVGYTNYIDELNEISAIYGKGKYADTSKFNVTTGKNTGGRSFKMEDLGYGSLTRTESYTYAMHNDELVYRYNVGEEVDGKSTTGGKYSTFKYMNMDASNTTEETEAGKEWTTLKTQADGGPTSVTMYQYTYPGSHTLSTTVSKSNTYYWLASRFLVFREKNIDFYTYFVGGHGTVTSACYYYSYGDAYSECYSCIRPVVYLDDNCRLEYNESTNSYNIF